MTDCTPDTHDWIPTPGTDTLTLRDPQTGAPVGCLMPVTCANCGIEADASWDLPR